MTDAPSRMTQELAALGAETRVERRVKGIVPWVLSLIIHLGVVTLALLITWTVSKLPQKDESVLIVADFNALSYEPLAGLDSAPQPAAGLVVRDMAPPLSSGETIDDQLRAAEGQPGLDVAAALGHSGNAGGSALSRFAPRAGAGSVSFAGVRGSNARKIVYVIDASGSMVSSNFIVIDELERSLQGLSPKQSFSVIFFQNNDGVELPPGGKLVPGTMDEKKRTIDWIKSIVPDGKTNPLAAIEKALTLKPDLVFLLSTGITGEGQFEIDQQDLLDLLDKLNPKDAATGHRAAQINCIQFLDADPLNMMERIAREHGGPNGYKFLSRKDLGLSGS